ncbi:MAG: glycosyltransferase [Methylophaga sp.]|nr:glycosyltransferase [Methylophaga sp.]
MMQKKISISMATFNGEKYVVEQIKSFLSQTRLPDEIIISDDCSSDETISVITNALQNSGIDLIVKNNPHPLGYAQNFNQALEMATGKIVFLSDQDDFWMPEKIEKIAKVFEDNYSIALVIHDLEYCDQDLKRLGHTKIKRLAKFTNFRKYHVTGMATAIRRDFLALCLPVPRDFLSHDTWIHLCAYYSGMKLVVPDVLALYRRHNDNATASQFVNSPARLNRFQLIFSKLKGLDFSILELSLVRHRLVFKWLNDNKQYLVKNHKVNNKKILFSSFKLKTKVYSLSFATFIYRNILKVRNYFV